MATEIDQQLWQAARDGDVEGINTAINQGADVNSRGEYDDTALNLAAEYGHAEAVERLVELGADIENLGGAAKTPLMNASFAGNIKIVKNLLDKGARINTDLLSSLQLKVNILEENAENGMVLQSGVDAWRGFLEFMVKKWQEQNPEEQA